MEIDLSAFEYPSKVSPETQAARDLAAEKLRSETGDSSLKDEQRSMRRLVQKRGTEEDRAVVTSSINQPIDISAFDKSEIDISAFDQKTSKEDTSWYDYPLDVGRFALKGMMGMGGAIAGGVGAIGSGIAHGSLDKATEAATSIMNDAVSPPEIQSKTVVGKTLDHLFEKGIEIARDYGAAMADEYFNTLGLSSENKARAIGYAASQAAPDIALTVAGLKSLKPREKTKSTQPLDIPPETPPPTGPRPEIIPEGSIPYEKVNITELIAERQKPTRPVDIEQVPYDRVNESLQGEAATPLSARSAGVDRPLDMQLDLFTKQDPNVLLESKLSFDPIQEAERAQTKLDIGRSFSEATVESAIEAANKPGFQRDAIDLLNIKEGQKKAPHLVGPRKHQAGAIDWSVFVPDALTDKQTIVNLVSGFKFLDKNWRRFANNSTIVPMSGEQWRTRTLDAMVDGKIMPKDIKLYMDGDIPAVAAIADGKIFVNMESKYMKSASPIDIAALLTHELTHGIQQLRKRYLNKTEEQWNLPHPQRPWEKEANLMMDVVYDRWDKQSKKPFQFIAAGFKDAFSGKVFNTGNMHLITKLPIEQQQKASGVNVPGFIGNDGKFYTREEAQTKLSQIDLKSNVLDGQVHSSNLFERDIPKQINKGTFGQSGAIDPSLFTEPIERVSRIFKNIFEQGKDPVKTKELFGPAVSTDQFIKEHIGLIDKMDDVPYQMGASSATFTASTPLIKKPNSLAAKTWHHFVEKIREASVIQHTMDHGFSEVFKSLEAQFHDTAIVGQVVPKSFKAEKIREFITHAVEIEKDPSSWFNGKDYYPTEQQLIQRGMDPKKANLLRRLYDVFETQWPVLEATAKMNNIPVPPRIPGWISHVFKGPYTVKIKKYDKKGTPDEVVKHLEEYNFPNEKRAKKALEEFNQIIQKHHQGQGVEAIYEPPKANKNTIQELLNGMWEAKDRLDPNGPGKGLQALMEAIYESSAKGIITSALERSKPPMKGHLFERVTRPPADVDVRGLTNKEVVQALRSLKDASEAVSSWYTRSKFVNETLFPLDQAGLLPAGSNLRQMTRSQMETFFRIPGKVFNELDTKVRDLLIRGGLDPSLAGSVAKGLNSGFSLYYLMGNIPYYIANSVQWTLGMSALGMIKNFGILNGEKTGSITRAIAEAGLHSESTLTLRKNNSLVKWANDHGHIDPVAIENLTPTKFKDPVALFIERRGRMASFQLGYHYFKQIFPHEEALKAAGRFTDMISVPYSREFGAPTMLSKIPVVGSALSVFVTYQQHMLGLLNQQLALTSRSVKEANPKALGTALTTMASTQAVNIALFGLAGMAGMSNWDAIARLLNSWFGSDVLTTKELGRVLDDTLAQNGMDTSSVFSHGYASQVLPGQPDITGSGSGPGWALPTAAFSAAGTALAAAILTTKKFSDRPPSKKEVWEVTRTMPKIPQTFFEYALKNDHLEDIWKTWIGEKPDYSPMKDINLPGQLRTLQETRMRMSFGVKSLREQDFNTSVAITNMKEQRIRDRTNKAIQLLKEGKLSPEQEQKIYNDLAMDAFVMPEQVMDAVIEYEMKKRMTEDERKALGGTTLQGFRKYEEYNKQRDLEGARQ